MIPDDQELAFLHNEIARVKNELATTQAILKELIALVLMREDKKLSDSELDQFYKLLGSGDEVTERILFEEDEKYRMKLKTIVDRLL